MNRQERRLRTRQLGKSAGAELDAGVAAQRSGRLDEAAATYRRVLHMQPANADALHLLGLVAFQQGRLDEAKELIARSIKLAPGVAHYHDNLGKVLLAQGRAEEGIRDIRRAVELLPSWGEAYVGLGTALIGAGQLEAAEAAYRQALTVKPELVEAWSDLSVALRRQGKLEEASAAALRAIAERPAYAEAYSNLGNVLRDQGKLSDAMTAFVEAQKLNPRMPEAYNNIGNTLVDLGQPEPAVAAFRHALELRPEYPEAHYSLAFPLLQRGELEAGLPEYEWRWRVSEFVQREGHATPRTWDGSPLDGTLLLRCEQGLGDTLQFVRYVSLAAKRATRVVLECPVELHRLLSHSLCHPEPFSSHPDPSCHPERRAKDPPPAATGDPSLDAQDDKQNAQDDKGGAVAVIVRGGSLPAHDTYAPLMSLPLLFGTRVEQIPAAVPYLHPEAQAEDRWGKRIPGDGRLKVGIVWAGNPANAIDRRRSASLAAFAPLAAVGGVQLFSLQKGPAAAQIEGTPLNITDLGPELTDFAETAAAISQLDLVVTVDTAVAHLAGALGKPVWVLLAAAADWRWFLDRDDSPWYPTMRLFRQFRAADWSEAIDRIAQDLRGLASGRDG